MPAQVIQQRCAESDQLRRVGVLQFGGNLPASGVAAGRLFREQRQEAGRDWIDLDELDAIIGIAIADDLRRLRLARPTADFKNSLPQLSLDSCDWLAAALRKLKPDHVWLKDLS